MRVIIFLFALCLSQNIFLFAQTESKIDSLKKLGRDSLVRLAIKKLNNPDFDPTGYDRIIVKAYKDKLIVEFRLSITLKASCFYDAVYVSLAGEGGGASIQGDCDEPKYHKYTKSERKKIQFVFDSINKSDEIGHIKDNKLANDDHMNITEKLTYYHIDVSDWSTHSEYKIDKISGKIYDAHHKHYARSHNEKPEYEVIN